MEQGRINTTGASYWFLVGRPDLPFTECHFFYNYDTGKWTISYDNEEPQPIKIDRKGKEYTAALYIRRKKKVKHFTLEYGGHTVNFTLDFASEHLFGKAFNDDVCPDYRGKDIVEFYPYDVKQINANYIQPIQTYFTKENDLFKSLIRVSNLFMKNYLYEHKIKINDVTITKKKMEKKNELYNALN